MGDDHPNTLAYLRTVEAFRQGDLDGLVSVFTPDGTYSAFGSTYTLARFPEADDIVVDWPDRYLAKVGDDLYADDHADQHTDQQHEAQDRHPGEQHDHQHQQCDPGRRAARHA